MSWPISLDRRSRAEALGVAFVTACELELQALKPGNVHVHAAGHGMTVDQFRISARAAAGPLTNPGAPVGMRIREAIAATRAAVGCNTNLGIVLLAAPLLAAAEAARSGLRPALADCLATLTREDAAETYAAIRLAEPAGLGAVEAEDIARPPSVTLVQAMALAAERDRIARQFVTNYADVFETGCAEVLSAQRRGHAPEWVATCVYMRFLAAFPDSHVARKHGGDQAESVRTQAAPLAAALANTLDPTSLSEALIAFDTALKAGGINPGTSADLTVASLLAFALQHILDSGPAAA